MPTGSSSISAQVSVPPRHPDDTGLTDMSGYGHSVQYFDPNKVKRYVALEPNVLMHDTIRKRAAVKGYTEDAGNLLILSCGAENTTAILSALGSLHAADTILAILSLCSIPDPERTLKNLVSEVLKPGGTLLFYEHVLSPRDDVAWWQRFWTPVWKWAFDGCCLDRPTHVWIRRMDAWEEGEEWGPKDEPEEHLFWHRIGKFVKAKSELWGE